MQAKLAVADHGTMKLQWAVFASESADATLPLLHLTTLKHRLRVLLAELDNCRRIMKGFPHLLAPGRWAYTTHKAVDLAQLQHWIDYIGKVKEYV